MIGNIIDYNRQKVELSHTSNAVENTMWLSIYDKGTDGPTTSQLTKDDALVLIALLMKGINEMEKEQ